MIKKVFGLFMLVALCASVFVPGRVRGEKPSQANGAGSQEGAAYVPGEVIVQFKKGASDIDKADARRLAKASRKERVKIKGGDDESSDSGLEVNAVGQGTTVEDSVRALKNHPAVEFAEPNYIFTKQATSNDERYMNGSLWGMDSAVTLPSNAYGSQAARAWDSGYMGSRNVVVAVIDEGIDFNHVDMAPNMWLNPYEVPGNGVDDDGNGYADDMRGWDFAANNNSVFDGRIGDNQTDDHGTHVAGTIGALGGNGIGVVGVNWQVTLISAKFLGSKGGTTANAIRALDYVTNLKKRHPEMNIVATNNSWGGGGYSQALHDAVIRAAKQNILFVVAAGNAGNSLDGRKQAFPAGMDTTAGTSTESGAGYNAVIAVAAIDASGRLATFSNYSAQQVDIGAPGVNIFSTAPNSTYLLMSGTSQATPHVTGAVALYAAAYPGAAPWTIRNAVLSSAVYTPSLAGKVRTNGRLDVYGALSR